MSNKEIDNLIKKSIGIYKYRLKNDLSEIERILVKKWHEMNNEDNLATRTTIDCLFTIHSKNEFPTDRDKIVAETIIQWLGTNVGCCFLQECGFYRSKIEEK